MAWLEIPRRFLVVLFILHVISSNTCISKLGEEDKGDSRPIIHLLAMKAFNENLVITCNICDCLRYPCENSLYSGTRF